MATLTANTPRLPGHCPHKLATSCLLTALPTCCACQDVRPHSSSYPTYIDGIGFVLRGTRHDRYCWMCKEFWNARIKASGLQPSGTRIPDIPDQSEFLKHWFDWHQGYRIIKYDDGSQEQETLQGEELSNVDVGFLPRTWDEMREGPSRQDFPTLNINPGHETADTLETASFVPRPVDAVVPLDDRLFDDDLDHDISPQPTTGLPSSSNSPDTSPRHATSLSGHRVSSPVITHEQVLPSHTSLNHSHAMDPRGRVPVVPEPTPRPPPLGTYAVAQGQAEIQRELRQVRRLVQELHDRHLRQLSVDVPDSGQNRSNPQGGQLPELNPRLREAMRFLNTDLRNEDLAVERETRQQPSMPGHAIRNDSNPSNSVDIQRNEPYFQSGRRVPHFLNQPPGFATSARSAVDNLDHLSLDPRPDGSSLSTSRSELPILPSPSSSPNTLSSPDTITTARNDASSSAGQDIPYASPHLTNSSLSTVTNRPHLLNSSSTSFSPDLVAAAEDDTLSRNGQGTSSANLASNNSIPPTMTNVTPPATSPSSVSSSDPIAAVREVTSALNARSVSSADLNSNNSNPPIEMNGLPMTSDSVLTAPDTMLTARDDTSSPNGQNFSSTGSNINSSVASTAMNGVRPLTSPSTLPTTRGSNNSILASARNGPPSTINHGIVPSGWTSNGLTLPTARRELPSLTHSSSTTTARNSNPLILPSSRTELPSANPSSTSAQPQLNGASHYGVANSLARENYETVLQIRRTLQNIDIRLMGNAAILNRIRARATSLADQPSHPVVANTLQGTSRYRPIPPAQSPLELRRARLTTRPFSGREPRIQSLISPPLYGQVIAQMRHSASLNTSSESSNPEGIRERINRAVELASAYTSDVNVGRLAMELDEAGLLRPEADAQAAADSQRERGNLLRRLMAESDSRGEEYISPVRQLFDEAHASYREMAQRRTRAPSPVPVTPPPAGEGLGHGNAGEPVTPGGHDAVEVERPEGLTAEQMTRNMQCYICYEQLATIACLPCGHCVMCRWCANRVIPSGRADRTRVRGHHPCPMCRRAVRGRVDIHFGS